MSTSSAKQNKTPITLINAATILLLVNLCFSTIPFVSLLPINTWTITALLISSASTIWKLPDQKMPHMLSFFPRKKTSKTNTITKLLILSTLYSLLTKTPGSTFFGFVVAFGNPVFTVLFISGISALSVIFLAMFEANITLAKNGNLTRVDQFNVYALGATLFLNMITTVSFFVPFLASNTFLSVLLHHSPLSFAPIMLSALYTISERAGEIMLKGEDIFSYWKSFSGKVSNLLNNPLVNAIWNQTPVSSSAFAPTLTESRSAQQMPSTESYSNTLSMS